MSWLIDRVRRHGTDRGAVTVLVAGLLCASLLLGIGALVIDSGQLRAERAELQNGADAAVFALAQDCGDGDGCPTTPYATATRYGGANAADGVSTANLVCGRDGANRLTACPAEGQSPCLGQRPAAGNFVEVRTSTRLTDGSTVLPPVFGRVLLGESYDGRGVLACARAAWGGPRAAQGLGMTISLCEWQAATSSGSVFAQAPPATVSASVERVLILHGSGLACAGGPSGWDLPGGFGWLNDDTGACQTQVDITGTYQDSTGLGVSHACRAVLDSARTNRETVLVPVFDGAGGTGHNGYYHLRGFASFVITGYNLTGQPAASTLTNRKPCTGDEKCVSGYFTRDLITTATALGGPDMGATTVQLLG
ncbi:Tad domain-containing protein [Actinophytocola sp.]|uniref:TadE/TadG family type IV pilus assembly protein n=1 Tax=Actinophytocola sp. TaxID=1872138 RepID=UPI002ED1962B